MTRLAIPFFPENSYTVAVTTTSSNTSVNKDGDTIRIYNAGANDVCVRWGIGVSQTALTTDMRIAAGNTETFTKHKADNFAAICPVGSATLYLTTGQGL